MRVRVAAGRAHGGDGGGARAAASFVLFVRSLRGGRGAAPRPALEADLEVLADAGGGRGKGLAHGTLRLRLDRDACRVAIGGPTQREALPRLGHDSGLFLPRHVRQRQRAVRLHHHHGVVHRSQLLLGSEARRGRPQAVNEHKTKHREESQTAYAQEH